VDKRKGGIVAVDERNFLERELEPLGALLALLGVVLWARSKEKPPPKPKVPWWKFWRTDPKF